MSEKITLVAEERATPTDAPVYIWGAAGTIIEVVPVVELLCDSASNAPRCEDCPSVNLHPPAKSDCPDFDNTGEYPVCKQDRATDEALNNWLNG